MGTPATSPPSDLPAETPDGPPPTPQPAPSRPDGPGVPLPNIADYWPDAPHRLGPPADSHEAAGAGPVRTTPAWHTPTGSRPTLRLPPDAPVPVPGPPPRRSARRPVVLLVALLTLGSAAAYAVLRPRAEPEIRTAPTPAATAPPIAVPPVAAPANPPVVIGTRSPSAPARRPPVPAAATFELAGGTTEINVTIGAVPGGWFRVTTPEGSGVAPRAVVDGTTLRVRVEPAGEEGAGEPGADGSARVDVLLSEDVTWAVRTRAGVDRATFDLARGRLSRIDLAGGAARIDLALPGQATAIPVLMTGGVHRWRISTQGKVPLRARFREGAGSVTLYGDRDRGVARDTALTLGRGRGGIDLNAGAGIGSLTVTAR